MVEVDKGKKVHIPRASPAHTHEHTHEHTRTHTQTYTHTHTHNTERDWTVGVKGRKVDPSRFRVSSALEGYAWDVGMRPGDHLVRVWETYVRAYAHT